MWEGPQIQVMKILKLALTSAPALKSIDYTEGVSEIIYRIDASDEGWEEVLMQVKRDRKRWHSI